MKTAPRLDPVAHMRLLRTTLEATRGDLRAAEQRKRDASVVAARAAIGERVEIPDLAKLTADATALRATEDGLIEQIVAAKRSALEDLLQQRQAFEVESGAAVNKANAAFKDTERQLQQLDRDAQMAESIERRAKRMTVEAEQDLKAFNPRALAAELRASS
jgi:uncharacterized protein involved in exopolysaccharide biosynthesis